MCLVINMLSLKDHLNIVVKVPKRVENVSLRLRRKQSHIRIQTI